MEDDNLLENNTTTWEKVSRDIKKEFDSQPVYNKECLETKIKSYGDETTEFHDKEITKADSTYTCLAVISLEFALRKYDYYYPQMFLKKYKYIEKKLLKLKVNKSVYIAKSRQRYHLTLNNILLHVSNHTLKDMHILNSGTF